MKPPVQQKDLDAIRQRIEALPKGEYGDVFRDGVVEVAQYNMAPVRILWVLKEAVGDDAKTRYDTQLIDDNIQRDTFGRTLSTIAFVSYAILNDIGTWAQIPPLLQGPAQALKKVAIINVKKSLGLRKSSNSLILDAFAQNKELICYQIEVCNPDIIIMGYPEACKPIVYGIIEHFDPQHPDQRLEEKSTCAYLPGQNWIYLWAYHPGKPGAGKNYCEEILAAVSACKRV